MGLTQELSETLDLPCHLELLTTGKEIEDLRNAVGVLQNSDHDLQEYVSNLQGDHAHLRITVAQMQQDMHRFLESRMHLGSTIEMHQHNVRETPVIKAKKLFAQVDPVVHDDLLFTKKQDDIDEENEILAQGKPTNTCT